MLHKATDEAVNPFHRVLKPLKLRFHRLQVKFSDACRDAVWVLPQCADVRIDLEERANVKDDTPVVPNFRDEP